ncbi:MAG TPA: hypothetical protein VNO33_03345, partial [Kofleriaceae bacterium]|nr:hypothetical protein [Kofleriaceae bacterium]
PLVVDYEALLEQMLHSESESVRLLTVFHIGELELGRFRPHIEQLARTEAPPGDAARALELLVEARHAG